MGKAILVVLAVLAIGVFVISKMKKRSPAEEVAFIEEKIKKLRDKQTKAKNG